MALAVLLLGLILVVANLFGGVLLDLPAFVTGRPWNAHPEGLLARAHEGFGVVALFSLPLAIGVLAVGWAGMQLAGGRLGRLGALLCLVGGWAFGFLVGPLLGMVYQRRVEAVGWQALSGQSASAEEWGRIYFDRVPPASRRLGALGELERRASGNDAAALVDLVGAVFRRENDPDLRRLKHPAAERLAVLAAAHPNRFLLSHLVAEIRSRGWEDDPDAARLLAVWEERIRGGL
jgi:hypothetical protein